MNTDKIKTYEKPTLVELDLQIEDAILNASFEIDEDMTGEWE